MTRCPSCGAAVRTDAPWCLLCHRKLQSDPEPPAGPAPAVVLVGAEAAGGHVAPDPGDPPPAGHAPAPAVADPTWPCTVCGAANPLAAPACTACGAAFLAPLRHAAQPGWRLPLVGDLTRLSRNARLALAAGVGLLATLLISGIMLAIGALL